MRIVWIRFTAIAVLTSALVWAQQPSNSSTAGAFENGSIANNVYTNDCLGFSLAIPAAWRLNTQFLGADGQARHAGGQLVLLLLDQHKEGSFGNRIVLTARDASGSAPGPEEFVSKSLHTQLDADREHRQMVKEAYSVNYGGKFFPAPITSRRSATAVRCTALLSTPSSEGSTSGKLTWLGRPRS